ncbi:MAG: tRNA 4-thiouridine(8) synthase ThiI, partial [Coriobacteriia bacterium]|nr:tRNA 4-thiouridine(8) synthase ThiI [Coriobacteriia bacterium]
QQINTFNISTETAPDCCTLFMPSNPQTHANLKQVHEQWSLLEADKYVQEIMDTIEVVDFESPVYQPYKGK